MKIYASLNYVLKKSGLEELRREKIKARGVNEKTDNWMHKRMK